LEDKAMKIGKDMKMWRYEDMEIKKQGPGDYHIIKLWI